MHFGEKVECEIHIYQGIYQCCDKPLFYTNYYWKYSVAETTKVSARTFDYELVRKKIPSLIFSLRQTLLVLAWIWKTDF